MEFEIYHIILMVVAAVIGIVLGILFYGMKDKEAKKRIANADLEATRIVNDGIRKSESKTKEMLLEAKEEIPDPALSTKRKSKSAGQN